MSENESKRPLDFIRAIVAKFIIGAGCEIPPNASLDNVRAMVKVGERLAGKRFG